MKIRELTNVIRKYLNTPYCLGGKNPAEGLDCLSLLHCVFGDLGIKLPTTCKDFTMDNYAEKWRRGEGREVFIEYVLSLGTEIGLNFIVAGDILLIDQDDFAVPAIYLGNRKILFAIEDSGIKVIPLEAVRPVKAVRVK